MNERLVRQALLPLHERLRGRATMRFYHRLRAHDRMQADAMQELQWQRLKKLLAHCLEHVPFYRDRLRGAGITDVNELTRQRYERLPQLTRDDIRNHKEAMVARGWRERLIQANTGGSTGEPLVFYSDRGKEACHNAQKLRARSWFGVMPGDRQVDFWGSPIELNKQSELRILKDRWLLNQVVLSAFNLTDQRLSDYVAFVVRFRPRLIYGYPTVIFRVAQWIREHPGVLGDYRPALVSCTSEMLYDHQRNMIREVFDCPVANEYGSRDGGLIAHECPQGSLHIIAEHVYLEVVGEDEEGAGDLLVTNLDGYGMPLLRYRIGDRGTLDNTPCACGLPLPCLARLSGRSNDFLVGHAGRLIHSLAPIYVLREIPKLRQFRLYQRKDHSLQLQMVSDAPFSDAELRDLREKLQRILDEPVPVDFQFAETIPPERSGKYRWVMSEAPVQ